MSLTNLRNALEWALMVALVLGAGAIARAQDDHAKPEGPIVQIGPVDDADAAPVVDQSRVPRTWPVPGFGGPARPEPARFWIGMSGGPVSPELRAHLDIPEDQGVLVREVVPNGPAAKAGLKNYDILLRANNVDLHDMRDLTDVVRSTGEQQGQITLEVLRRSQRETVWVSPEEQPDRPTQPGWGFGRGRGFGGRWGGGDDGGFDGFGVGGNPFDFRWFGPGAVVEGRAFGFAAIPNGVSVRIQKHNDEPAQITVQRGDETWEIVGDDPKSLDQLPEDLRPFVEQMLGQTGHHGFNVTMPTMPAIPAAPAMPRFGGDQESRLQQRLEAMDRRLQEFERRLRGPAGTDQRETE